MIRRRGQVQKKYDQELSRELWTNQTAYYRNCSHPEAGNKDQDISSAVSIQTLSCCHDDIMAGSSAIWQSKAILA